MSYKEEGVTWIENNREAQKNQLELCIHPMKPED